MIEGLRRDWFFWGAVAGWRARKVESQVWGFFYARWNPEVRSCVASRGLPSCRPAGTDGTAGDFRWERPWERWSVTGPTG